MELMRQGRYKQAGPALAWPARTDTYFFEQDHDAHTEQLG
jgi:hypothetical protein